MAESVFHVEGSTSTLLGILNQFHGASDLNYNILLSTTINTKRNVLPNIAAPSLPLLRYYGIGINGFYNTDDVNSRSPHQPLPTNLDLYEPIPFRCVPIENDLTPTQRANYRMREVREIDGHYYCLYWLKLITYKSNLEQSPNENPTVSIIQKFPNGEEDTFVIADPAAIHSRLNPVPPVPVTGGETPLSQNRLIVRATGECEITGAEVSEAVNVLYEGNYNKALISEMGFYTGCEIHIIGAESGYESAVMINNSVVPVIADVAAPAEATGKEAVYVQLSKHRCFNGLDLSNQTSIATPTIAFEAGGVIDI